MRPLISLQMYTVRDLTAQDMLGTLQKVAELGFEGIELAGYGSASRDEVIAATKELGLKITGNHVSLDKLRDDFDGVVAENLALGNQFVIVPHLGEQWRCSRENWEKTAALLDELGAKLKAKGLTLAYHNHAFEFEEAFDGEYALDLLWANSSPENLKAEVDVYWVKRGGEDPAAYLTKHAGRVPLVHVKDMNTEGYFAEVGTGVLEFDTIFAAAEAGGVVTYVVEQDVCPGNPLDSIAISIDNLKKWGKVSA